MSDLARVDLLTALAGSDLNAEDRRDILGLILCDQLGLARVALAGCIKALEAGVSVVCQFCGQPITHRTVEEYGYLPRTGWATDHSRDALVCFRALHYSHAPTVAGQS